MRPLGCFWNFFEIFFAHKKLKKPHPKVACLWQLGVFFLCSPDCPKLPRTSFPFYKFFYSSISGKISAYDARHHDRHSITNCSWILTIHKGRIFWKKTSLNKRFWPLKSGFKNIQTARYNGARMVMKWSIKYEIRWNCMTTLNLVAQAL